MRNRIALWAVLACSVMGLAQNPQSGSGHIFVVRHAEKESENADTLSAQGKARAACLAATLKDANIKMVITSLFERTKQTGEPTAAEHHLRSIGVKADQFAAIANAAKRGAGEGDVLVVGHSNTVPQIVKQLSNVDVQVGDAEYDKLFVIDSAGVAQLHYCPTSAAEPESRMK